MKDEKALYREILNEKNLSENINVFYKSCAGINYVYASMELTINYFNLYESQIDSDIAPSDEFVHYLMAINKYIRKHLLDSEALSKDKRNTKEAIEELDKLRNIIIDKMQMLTIYADKFLLYEYILNRMHLSFNDIVEDINQDKLHEDIMNYIFSEKDKVIVNEKIRNALYHMPIRMTKSKFIDLIKSAVYMYIGHERSSLNDFIYKIKSSAGIQEQIQIDEVYEQKLELLKGIDYNSIEKEKYEELLNEMTDIVKLLYKETDNYYSLQEIVNSLYAIMLNMDFAGEKELQYIKKFMPEVCSINDRFNQIYQDFDKESLESYQLNQESLDDNNDYQNVDSQNKDNNFYNNDTMDMIEIPKIFEAMEGKLEEYSEKLQNSQMVLSKIMEENNRAYEDYRSLDIYKTLETSQKLLSQSLFIDFRNKPMNEIIDKNYAFELVSLLSDEFLRYMSMQNKTLNRAMIASVLKELPLSFTDSKSVSDYIKTSFSSCHDIAERVCSYNMIMAEVDD